MNSIKRLGVQCSDRELTQHVLGPELNPGTERGKGEKKPYMLQNGVLKYFESWKFKCFTIFA